LELEVLKELDKTDKTGVH